MPPVRAREISRGDTILETPGRIAGVSRAFWNHRGYNIAVENWGREKMLLFPTGNETVIRIALAKDRVA